MFPSTTNMGYACYIAYDLVEIVQHHCLPKVKAHLHRLLCHIGAVSVKGSAPMQLLNLHSTVLMHVHHLNIVCTISGLGTVLPAGFGNISVHSCMAAIKHIQKS